MPAAVPSDQSGVLVDKLKHAFTTYDSASKKYLMAVKDLDSAMEQLAIAFRVLSQGETDEATKAKCESFCTAVDSHKCGADSAGSSSTRKKSTAEASTTVRQTPAPGDEESYYFSIYISDFARDISAPLEELRAEVRSLAKSKSVRDEIVKKYEKTCHEIDSLESKLAKKNQGVSESAEFAKKVAKREERKTLKESAETQFDTEYRALLVKRSEVLQKMLSAMSHYSSMYYEGISKTLKPRG